MCLSAVVLAGGIVLSAAARGGHSGGDSGHHQYGSKPACKQHKRASTATRRASLRYGYAKDCPKYKPHHKKNQRYAR